MRRREAVAALGSACAAGWAAPARAQDASGRVALPDARLLDQAGGAHRLRALCDRPVVVGFFYTGCSTASSGRTGRGRPLGPHPSHGRGRLGSCRESRADGQYCG